MMKKPGTEMNSAHLPDRRRGKKGPRSSSKAFRRPRADLQRQVAERQRQVADLTNRGLCAADIAHALQIERATVARDLKALEQIWHEHALRDRRTVLRSRGGQAGAGEGCSLAGVPNRPEPSRRSPSQPLSHDLPADLRTVGTTAAIVRPRDVSLASGRPAAAGRPFCSSSRSGVGRSWKSSSGSKRPRRNATRRSWSGRCPAMNRLHRIRWVAYR